MWWGMSWGGGRWWRRTWQQLSSDSLAGEDLQCQVIRFVKRKRTVNFPSAWPQGCPPENAEAASGELFRVAKTNPPSAEDFKSHEELGKKSTGPQCLRVGLSLFQTIDDAEHLTQLFPKLGRYVLRGQLQPHHGVTKLTPSNRYPTHTTWWPYEGVNRAEPFSLALSP